MSCQNISHRHRASSRMTPLCIVLWPAKGTARLSRGISRRWNNGRPHGAWASTPQNAAYSGSQERKKRYYHTYWRTKIESSEIAGYLRVTIAQDLSWNTHIAKVIAKGNRTLGFLKRNIQTKSETTKTNAYNTIVRPTLEYATSVWAPGYKTLISALEAVQRTAALHVSNNCGRRKSVTNMMKVSGWESLEERKNKLRVSVIFKIVNKRIAIPDT